MFKKHENILSFVNNQERTTAEKYLIYLVNFFKVTKVYYLTVLEARGEKMLALAGVRLSRRV